MSIDNSLAQRYPHLATQWHPTKNGDLTPADVKYGTDRVVWWQCEVDPRHEWEAPVSRRSTGNTGCPVCAGKVVIPGVNDFASACPEAANVWHPTKNLPLTPQQLTRGSKKEVWWVCEKGHDYLSTPHAQSKRVRCTICHGRKTYAGINDLATTHPEIAATWDQELNGELTPQQVTAKTSSRVVYWRCSEGHSWSAKPEVRVKAGCPVCSGARIQSGYNDVATKHPGLVALLHPTKNSDPDILSKVGVSSQERVWFTCPLGHEYERTVSTAVRSGYTCAVCTGKYVQAGVNDIATTCPEAAAQWHPTKNHPLLPTQVSRASDKKVWWVCPQGHEMYGAVKDRVKAVSRVVDGAASPGCTVCSGAKLLSGFNDLQTMRPDLAAQWHPTKNDKLEPKVVRAKSVEKAWWQCAEGHEWEATVYSRAIGGNGCPYCAGQRLLAGVNDLASAHPDLAAQWHPTKNPLSPEEVTVGNDYKAWWVCDKGHEPWKASVYSRARMGTGCPVCAGNVAQVGLNDLATLRPDLAAQWHPTKNGDLLPSQVSVRSSANNVWWQCERGHDWQATPANRGGGKNCPVCSGQRVLAGFNDFASAYPELATEWHPTKNGNLTPSDVTRSSSAKVWWQCAKGHEWETWVYTRSGGSGCPECAAAAFVSKGETEVREIIKRLLPDAEIRQSDRQTLNGSRANGYGNGELDIYLPERKFAVEFNGIYWHSEAGGKSKDYHALKQQACERAGIELYQIWEDDWRDRRSIVIRGLAHRLGVTHRLQEVLPDLPEYFTQSVGARQCQVVEVSTDDARAFLQEHHIQGFASGSYYFGLQDAQERLRALLVVKRNSKPGVYYIERYATAGTVQGGFTRLLKHAEKQIDDLTQWVTFADLSLSNGALYRNNGFIADKVLEPDYSYLVKGSRVHKFNYRLARFKSDPDLVWEDGLSERELAALNGLHRVWDAGKVRWVKTL